MATIWLRFDGFPTGGTYVATLHDKDTDEYYDAVAQDWGGTIGGADNEITLTELTAEYAGSYEATAVLPADGFVRKITVTLHDTANSDKPLGSDIIFVRNGAEVHEGDLSFDVAAVSTKLGSPAGASVSADIAAIFGKYTGITSLAQWLGLIAGKQTGNSTARTELRATGAGSGTYDETTDSLEALSAQVADGYTANIEFNLDNTNTQDEYTVIWRKNLSILSSGITSPTIQVYKRADGTDLVASTSMTQIGSSGKYKYTEGTNRVTLGESVIVKVVATIDGSSRSWEKVVTRDATA